MLKPNHSSEQQLLYDNLQTLFEPPEQEVSREMELVIMIYCENRIFQKSSNNHRERFLSVPKFWNYP